MSRRSLPKPLLIKTNICLNLIVWANICLIIMFLKKQWIESNSGASTHGKPKKVSMSWAFWNFCPLKWEPIWLWMFITRLYCFHFHYANMKNWKKKYLFFQTISKVKLFHGCDPGLIKSLVIKLQPMLFLPGDYICKKGDDIGKEICIVY